MKTPIKKTIGTFKEYCRTKQIKKLNEDSQVAVKVPFWDDAINVVLGLFHSRFGEPIDWDMLLDFCKKKFFILSRPQQDFEDDYVLAHIRDILYDRFGDAYFDSEDDSQTISSELGTKILVINELASAILNQVRIEAGQIIPPLPELDPKPIATVSLEDWVPGDDFFENSKHVKGFGKYTKMLTEAVGQIRYHHYGECLQYTLDTIIKDAGSLAFSDVLSAAEDEVDAEDQVKLVSKYIEKIVMSYLTKEKVTVTSKDKAVDYNDVINQARDILCHEIVAEVLEKIQNETAGKD